MIIRIKHIVEYILVKIFFFIFSVISWERASNLSASIVASIGIKLSISSRIEKNLKIAFPNIEQREIKQIEIKVWQNIGRFMAEFAKIGTIDQNNIDNIVECRNWEIIQELTSQNKGFFVCTAHLGNWELITRKFVLCKVPRLAALYRPMNNKIIDKLVIKTRKLEMIPKGMSAIRNLIQKIKANYSIAVFLDQRTNEGSRLPFFGKDAMTSSLIPELSLKYNYPIIPIKVIRKQDTPNKFIMTVYKPLCVNKTNDNAQDILNLAKKANSLFEEWIREDKDQWFWLHNRWK